MSKLLTILVVVGVAITGFVVIFRPSSSPDGAAPVGGGSPSLPYSVTTQFPSEVPVGGATFFSVAVTPIVASATDTTWPHGLYLSIFNLGMSNGSQLGWASNLTGDDPWGFANVWRVDSNRTWPKSFGGWIYTGETPVEATVDVSVWTQTGDSPPTFLSWGDLLSGWTDGASGLGRGRITFSVVETVAKQTAAVAGVELESADPVRTESFGNSLPTPSATAFPPESTPPRTDNYSLDCGDASLSGVLSSPRSLCFSFLPSQTTAGNWSTYMINVSGPQLQSLSQMSAWVRLIPQNRGDTITLLDWDGDLRSQSSVTLPLRIPTVPKGNYTVVAHASATSLNNRTVSGSGTAYLSVTDEGKVVPIRNLTLDSGPSSGRLVSLQSTNSSYSQASPSTVMVKTTDSELGATSPTPQVSCGSGQIYVTGQVFFAQQVTNSVTGTLPVSPHPYTNNWAYYREIVDTGVSSITLTFSKIEIESGWDHLYVRDKYGNVVWQTDTGFHGIVTYTNQVVTVYTDVVQIVMTTDSSVTAWGFEVASWYRNNALWRGLKWATIQIWDASAFGDSLLQTLQAGADGGFTSGCLSNADEWDTRDIYFKAVLDSDKAAVRMSSGAAYAGTSDTRWDVPDGQVNFGSYYTTSASNPAYIIYVALMDGWDFVRYGPAGFSAGKVTALWTYGHDGYYCGVDNTDTHYHSSGSCAGEIHVNSPQGESPDVILHEYGHFIQQQAYNGWVPSNLCSTPHYWEGYACNAETAWFEGYADFFFAPVVQYAGTGNQVFNDYFQGIREDLETTPSWSQNGDRNEGSVAAALYDIYDSAADGADTYAGGFGRIWNVLRSGQQATISAWFSSWRSYFSSSPYDIHYGKVDLYQNKINYDTNAPWINSFATVTAPTNGYYRGTVQVHAQIGDSDTEDSYYLRLVFKSSPNQLDPWYSFYDVTSGSGWRDGYWDTTKVSDGIQYLASTVDDQMQYIGGGYLGPLYIDNTPPTQPGNPSWDSYDERDGSFAMTWTASSDGYSGFWYYELQQQANGGAWTTLSSTITGTSYTIVYVPPGTYSYRVRAEDRAGNWGAFSAVTTTTIPWDTRMTNNPAVSSSQVTAVDRFGNYHIVWVDARDGNNEIYYKKVDPNWNVLVGDTRLTNNNADSVQPAVTILVDNVYVVWSDKRDGNYEIYWKLFSGGSWGSDIRLTNTPADSKEPDIAVDGSDNRFWVWREVSRTSQTEAEKIQFRTGVTTTDLYWWNGSAISQSHSDRLASPHIALGASGTRHIVFSRGPAYPVEGGTSYMYYRRYASGAWGSVVQLGTNVDVARRTMVDADSSNHVYVAWDKWGNGFDIAFRKSNDGGSTWSTEQTFGGGSSYYQVYSDVAYGPGGKVYLTWSDNSAGQYEIYVAKSSSYGDSGTWSAAVRVTNNAGNSLLSRFAIDQSSGKVGLVWSDSRDGNAEIYFAAKFL
ncbi:MAG: hypothetical protein WC985_00260 [Thermoplasmata archaeon]